MTASLASVSWYKMRLKETLKILNREIVACELCPRLRAYDRDVARVKRRAYMDWDYWGKPVPGFGDPDARVLLIGLGIFCIGRCMRPGSHRKLRAARGKTDWSFAALTLQPLRAVRRQTTNRCRRNLHDAVRIWSANSNC